ncbi:MAG: DUF1858 domain-containing protein [Deinococcus sp.]|nr:DUF1858 domain-containing protein [Deinococcus sp.]
MITPDMSFADVIGTYPRTVAVFFRFGIDCLSCSASPHLTLGSLREELTPEEFQQLLAELNRVTQETPKGA